MGIRDIFIDKTCTIWSVGYTDNGASEVYSRTILYQNIPCDFWENSGEFKANNSVREDRDNRRTAVLNNTYNLVMEGYEIEIFDNYGTSKGLFRIDRVQPYLNLIGDVDNIELKLTQVGE